MNDEMQKFLRERAEEPKHLPVLDRNGVPTPGITAVATATENEIRRFSFGGHVCGECTYCERGHAQAEMARQKFLPSLVRDYEWKLDHAFTTGVDAAAICGASGGTVLLAAGAMTAACDQFRPANGRIQREAKTSELEKIGDQLSDAKRMQRRRIRDWKKKRGLDRPPGM